MSDRMNLADLLARVDDEMNEKLGYLPLVRVEIGEMATRLRAIQEEVDANMSSRHYYTLSALSDTILRVDRILNGGT